MQRILIVEDSPVDRALYETMLDAPSLEITYDDGSGAWNYICSNPPGDLVIVDLLLKETPGLRIISQLRGNPYWADVPIVVVSSVRDRARVKQVIAAGVNDFVSKPFDVKKLRATIEQHIGPLQEADSTEVAE